VKFREIIESSIRIPLSSFTEVLHNYCVDTGLALPFALADINLEKSISKAGCVLIFNIRHKSHESLKEFVFFFRISCLDDET